MPKRKQNILNKIVKKNYNNELEEILEQKNFGENVKSTLLSILYKIEASYKDIQTVKKDIESKEEYIKNILEIITNKCDSIKIIKMNNNENVIPKNRTYVVNKEKNEIIAYPIERKILYAIAKIGKKDKIIKDDYYLINKTISDLINVGNNINIVEPLRDFNGYSWTTIPQEIESIDHNLIYQNLRILIGNDFLNKWIKNNEFIIDYYELFNEELENKFGKENKEKIIDVISRLSVLLEVKFNKEKSNEYKNEKNKIEEELEKFENNEEFIEKIIKDKFQIADKIKNIDTIINNKKLLQEEYIKRNENLSLDKKIFSMRILSKMMVDEKDEYFKKIEELNEMINPQNFIKYKKSLEEKYKYLKILDIEDKEKEIDNLKIRLQKIFLECLKTQINKAETKQEIEKIIYDYRYYLMLQYNIQNNIYNEKILQSKIKKISNLIINKATELNAINKLSNNKETNYEILEKIFQVRIINLEDAYLKITKEKDKYFVQIFDENIFEEKIEISKPKDLEIKLNKKEKII